MTNLMILLYILCGLAGVIIVVVSIRKTAKRIRKNAQKGLDVCWSIGYRHLPHPFKFDFVDGIPTYNKFQIRVPAETVADPFLVRDDDTLYLFHEIVFEGGDRGKIAVSVFDPGNNRWEYQGVVIDEPFHLSYPYVFSADGRYYMIPESKAAKSVRLYVATEFPMKWELVKPVIENRKLVDPSVVFFEGKYYLFANRKKRLYLFYADDVTGEWIPHPKSPVRRGNYSRCAGRIIQYRGALFRPAQEQSKGYGNSMRIFRIRKLSKSEYRETPVSKENFLRPFGKTWARFGMHHFDVLQYSEGDYFAVFDGKGVPVPPKSPQKKTTITASNA